MGKSTSRHFILLTLPSLALVALGFYGSAGKSKPVIEKVEISKIPLAERYNNYDTRVNVIFKYNSTSLYKRFIAGPTWDTALSVFDKKGKPYPQNRFEQVVYLGKQRYAISLEMLLAHVRSDEQLTVKGKAVIDKKWTFPISVNLNDKRLWH
jgi:hypothetical protein